MHVHQVLALIHEEKQQNRHLITVMYAVATRHNKGMTQPDRLALYLGAMKGLEQLAEALCDV